MCARLAGCAGNGAEPCGDCSRRGGESAPNRAPNEWRCPRVLVSVNDAPETDRPGCRAQCLLVGFLAGASDVLAASARRVEQLSEEITAIDHDLLILVADVAPHLLDECGVGAVCAAQLVVSSGDPGRMANEASFAALAGTPGGRFQRQEAASPPQPRRRSPIQLGATRDRIAAHPSSPRDGRLLRAPPRIRQERPRSTPLRQARARPPLLPRTSLDTDTRLDNIEASVSGPPTARTSCLRHPPASVGRRGRPL